MERFIKELQIRWSDLDQNGHLRHSVYYDWGAYCRILFLSGQGLTATRMMELQVGPVLFREEAVFKKEIRLEDAVFIDLELTASRRDFSRWAVQHRIYKGDQVLAAVLHLEGAWMDTNKRKLTAPPPEVADAYAAMPLAADFRWQEPS
ncbi:acyl-CoA thioesterase [Niabella beijingensis]|uniref:acyl-CoA thioesterase n=1 Tax=Niabella beijingensis TaxID=2872700 RepID=UPI001CBDC806|nr:thioesterase family protein [Niabella beijingensis]MBZ4190952.1 acyl-CoA thioesterase [Niabella beijingensis]